MLDSYLRPIIDPPLNAAARFLIALGATPVLLTAAGFVCSCISFGFLAASNYLFSLFFIALSRLMDGLDGPVARQTRLTAADGSEVTAESDIGAFLDIVSDFFFYSGTVFFFAVGQPEYALWAAFLIFSFVAAGTTFLAYAIFASKRGMNHSKQGKKGFFYLSGITEGTETITLFVVICLFPQFFPFFAGGYGVLCFLTAFGRVRQAVGDFTPEVVQK